MGLYLADWTLTVPEPFQACCLWFSFPETTSKEIIIARSFSVLRRKTDSGPATVTGTPSTRNTFRLTQTHTLFLLHFINASVLQTHFVNLTTFPAKPCSNKTVCVQSNMPSTYRISNNNTSSYHWENRVWEQCSLTTSRHSDFTQEMSIEREIEGQIDSLWGKKQTDDLRQTDRGKKRIREETVLILKTTRGFRYEGERGKKTQRWLVCYVYVLNCTGHTAVTSEQKSETETLNNVIFNLQVLSWRKFTLHVSVKLIDHSNILLIMRSNNLFVKGINVI